MKGVIRRIGSGLFLLFLVRCGEQSPGTPLPDAGADVPRPTYTLDQLKNPETCNACHKRHYREWSGSMHAYASDDPLFLAMNERGQREANIKNFCVNCHAPMAVASVPEGTVVDTAMLKELPKSKRGVTCYFCHSIDDVTGTHNNPLHLANDGVMRGRFTDAVPNEAHASAYSQLLDGTEPGSARACGSCHDIVNDKGAHIERTFEEWSDSVFSYPTGQTCAQCHMRQTQPEVIADGPKVQGVFSRLGHEHTMAAVDRALTDFPEIEGQSQAISRALNEPPELQTALCVSNLSPTDTRLVVLVANVQAGHKWPSGAAQDRQLWFEVTAYAGGTQVYQSGARPDGKDPDDKSDEDFWVMRDCLYDELGKETHLFWDAFTHEGNTLPAQLTLNQMDPRYYQTHFSRAFPLPDSTTRITTMPDRVTLKVWLQAFPYVVFDEFTDEMKSSLGFDNAQLATMRAKLAPVQVSTNFKAGPNGVLEWTPDAATEQADKGTFTNNAGLIPALPRNVFVRCVTYTGMIMRAQNVLPPVTKACGSSPRTVPAARGSL